MGLLRLDVAEIGDFHHHFQVFLGSSVWMKKETLVSAIRSIRQLAADSEQIVQGCAKLH